MRLEELRDGWFLLGEIIDGFSRLDAQRHLLRDKPVQRIERIVADGTDLVPQGGPTHEGEVHVGSLANAPLRERVLEAAVDGRHSPGCGGVEEPQCARRRVDEKALRVLPAIAELPSQRVRDKIQRILQIRREVSDAVADALREEKTPETGNGGDNVKLDAFVEHLHIAIEGFARVGERCEQGTQRGGTVFRLVTRAPDKNQKKEQGKNAFHESFSVTM